MKIVCQTCSQLLPKTTVMCPNCGGRSFVPQDQSPIVGIDMSEALHLPQQYYNQSIGQPFDNRYQQTDYQQNDYQQNNYTENHQTAYQEPVSQGYESNQAPMTEPTVLPPTRYEGKRANQMRYTGVFKRGFAWLLDLLLIGVILGLGYQLVLPDLLKMAGMTALNEPTLAVIAVSVYVLYMTIFTCGRRQGTIGKAIMGLWVFDINGRRIGFFYALIREVFKVVLLPLFFVAWFSARKQTLADLITRTVVLYDPS